MGEKRYFLTEQGNARNNKANAAILGRMPTIQKQTRRVPLPPANPANVGGTIDCGCCNGFNCANVDQLNIVGCSECVDGATYKYRFSLGNWSAYPALSADFLYHDTGCVWKSETITVSGGVYQWVLTQAGQDTTLQLTHVSGSDPIGLLDAVEIIYKVADQWTCACEAKLIPSHPERFPINRVGLNLTVCLVPVDVPCACCLEVIVDTTGLTGNCLTHLGSSTVLSVYSHCYGEIGISDQTCTFAAGQGAPCCGEGVDTYPCWQVTYNQDTRELGVYHSDLDDSSQQPQYKMTLEEGQSICSMGTIEVPLNTSQYPSLSCGGNPMPATVTISIIDCSYGYGAPGGCAEGCDWTSVSNGDGTFSWSVEYGHECQTCGGCDQPPIDPTFGATYHTNCRDA